MGVSQECTLLFCWYKNRLITLFSVFRTEFQYLFCTHGEMICEGKDKIQAIFEHKRLVILSVLMFAAVCQNLLESNTTINVQGWGKIELMKLLTVMFDPLYNTHLLIFVMIHYGAWNSVSFIFQPVLCLLINPRLSMLRTVIMIIKYS